MTKVLLRSALTEQHLPQTPDAAVRQRTPDQAPKAPRGGSFDHRTNQSQGRILHSTGSTEHGERPE
eukprot:329111-Heterocapsa_arctica.AAC.1